MKEQRFEKVVISDTFDLFIAFACMILCIYTIINGFYSQNNVLQGLNYSLSALGFIGFFAGIANYLPTRKVYWRKVK